jgi:hypothetical protein
MTQGGFVAEGVYGVGKGSDDGRTEWSKISKIVARRGWNGKRVEGGKVKFHGGVPDEEWSLYSRSSLSRKKRGNLQARPTQSSGLRFQNLNRVHNPRDFELHGWFLNLRSSLHFTHLRMMVAFIINTRGSVP